MIKICIFISLILICNLPVASAQNFQLRKSGLFKPQNKEVLLFRDSAENNLIIFKTKLQVNTDGTPVSYHPFDLNGSHKAINTIANAIVVKKVGSDKNLCLDPKTYSEAIGVFKLYRDSNYSIVPKGYSIYWKNVLIPENSGGIEKPCIIKTGEYKGYFASATSLKNGLLTNRGECESDNQVNPLKVPALVLVGGTDNIVKKFGAGLGDLVIAYNPVNKRVVYAIINDFGPKHNLGEGSVLLNMMLLAKDKFPVNRKDTYRLITHKEIIITIIPSSRNFNLIKPYTVENINERVDSWLKVAGFQSQKNFVEFIEKNMSVLSHD